MRVDWMRLIVQILSALAGGIGAVNLGRLTTPDSAAGPWDLAGWVGVPAVASVAAAVGQGFMRGASTPDKPGCAGHKQVCDTLYQLALDGQWDRAQAVIEAWKQTTAGAKRETLP
jgi:hypothetical protein